MKFSIFLFTLLMLTSPALADPPHLTLFVNPVSPKIQATSPGGTYVATLTAVWSNGRRFTGTYGFGKPYSNDNNAFTISGNTLIVNPNGPSLSCCAGTVQMVTVTATQ